MFDCLVCGTRLEYQETDDRQEWRNESYSCPKCGQEHERHTTYQCQSVLIASDEFYAVDGHGHELSPEEIEGLRNKYYELEESAC